MASPSASPAVLQQHRELMQECQGLITKITELEMDLHEHKLVEETLVPLDPSRRAFRLVGGVLVERTVQEVLPSVKTNRENLDKVIETLRQRLNAKQKETAEFKAKHNLVNEQA
mmetsp:Transcript_23436/g.32732  ORF Transcript_23436/g.32732 Transcript_23436/m.32732 type:complete len:114 (+) Transcript_23436:115-456(+)